MENKKVLIVDDNVVRNILVDFLGIKGIKAVSAENGKEGLSKLIEEKPDLVLCDYNMPVMDGYEFTHKLRTDSLYKEWKDIPIIGIGDFPKDKQQYLKGCFPKPFLPSVLVDKVKQYL